ncbi:MAG TPA: cytochrome C oxidase subunit IV family protein [Acidisarcina sp.]
MADYNAEHKMAPTTVGTPIPKLDENDPNPAHEEPHIVPRLLYIKIFAALLVGTGLTVGAAFVDMGPFNPVLAILIACIKAVLVVLFFMHVFYSSRLMKLTVAAGFFTFLVLITMTLTDYLSRAWGLW